MLRQTLLYLSNQQRVFRFVRGNRLAKGMARRFVAGETVDEAVAAVRGLNAKGITVSLDLLGESVHNEAEARATAREYVQLLDRIAKDGLDANVSVKLTAMGMDVSDDLCLASIHEVLRCARSHGNFVRLDMESSAYTDRTLDLFEQHLYPLYPENVGIVLQSMLRRTQADVERAVRLHARVRLCKGAYREPPEIAFPDKADVDESFVRAMKRLMTDGNYPGLATHDERIIEQAQRFARENHLAADRFEFQMLLGVAGDLRRRLVASGHRLRVYVPYGEAWEAYSLRRLKENPAIAGHVLKGLLGGK